MNPFSLKIAIPLILLTMLAACGSAGPPRSPAFSPVRPDPTNTPVSGPAMAAASPAPTSVVSRQVTVTTYTHPGGRFSINLPENWRRSERPNGVVFLDPGGHAGYSVVMANVGRVYSPEELNQYLVTFVAQNFVNTESNFSAISQKTRPDGSVVARFTTLDPKLGPTTHEVRVRQQDTIVFVLLITATEEQWQISSAGLQALADSFTPLNTGPLATPTPQPPSWVLVGPTSNLFGFLYPSDWEILHQDDSRVVVKMPDYDVLFEAGVSDLPASGDTPAAAARAEARAYLDTVAAQNSDMQSLPPEDFPLDGMAGVTIDFLYTSPQGQAMAGSVIAAANSRNLYRITFSAPADIYQATLEWFNPMYKSFKALSPEDLILDNE